MSVGSQGDVFAETQGRIAAVVGAVCKNLPAGEEVEARFVSNPPSGGGPSNISVWIFTRNLVVEVRNPHIDGRIQHDLAPFRESVDWMRLDAHNYNFEDVRPESRLKLEFTTRDGLNGELYATGEACSELMGIYRKRFLPNFLWTLKRFDEEDCHPSSSGGE